MSPVSKSQGAVTYLNNRFEAAQQSQTGQNTVMWTNEITDVRLQDAVKHAVKYDRNHAVCICVEETKLDAKDNRDYIEKTFRFLGAHTKSHAVETLENLRESLNADEFFVIDVTKKNSRGLMQLVDLAVPTVFVSNGEIDSVFLPITTSPDAAKCALWMEGPLNNQVFTDDDGLMITVVIDMK